MGSGRVMVQKEESSKENIFIYFKYVRQDR